MSIEQAIETAMRWQEEFTWRQAAKAVSDFKHRREMAQKDAAVVWQTERKIAELQSRLAGELSADTRRDLEAELSQETAFRDGEAFESFFKHAELNDRISEQKHAEAVAMQRELLALEWFVREHCPHLLGDVPAVHVFGTLPDVAAGIAAMRRLEGALRGLMVSGSEKSTSSQQCTGRLVTVSDVAEMLLDVDAKTLQNHDVKFWGPADGKVNRSRAWNWDRIRPIVLEKRRLRET